jgi:hypothetical protein
MAKSSTPAALTAEAESLLAFCKTIAAEIESESIKDSKEFRRFVLTNLVKI